jgi:xanthine dehydrogenase YagS FAD-binding subunit
MRDFNYVRASNPADATAALSGDTGRIIAGGTDILPLMKDDLTTPDTLIDISQWREGREIRSTNAGLEIGALVTLSEIASHHDIQARYTALAEACSLSAAPQLRNMGTIGGNLLQATRCWYYRGPYDCWLKGGERCYARNGENELHSILLTSHDESVCVSAHPSDPAVALLALDATVRYTTAGGSADVPLARFYRLPTSDRRTMIDIPPDAVITGVSIPAFSGKSLYRKAMSRATWTFALASVALAIRTEGDTIGEVRIAVGGVAPVPVRMSSVEREMIGKLSSELDSDELSRALVQDARPLSQNGYKVTVLQGLFREALAALNS